MEQGSLEQSLSETIRASLRSNGRTQAELALALGVGQPRISDRLNGRVKWSAVEVQHVADFLDVPVSTLLRTALADA